MVDAAGLLNIRGIDGQITELLGAAVLALALSMAVRAHASRLTKVIEMIFIVLIAALVVGLAHGTNFAAVGTKLFNTIFG